MDLFTIELDLSRWSIGLHKKANLSSALFMSRIHFYLALIVDTRKS